ncbi:EAL domain-containing protein [Profundibacterium mesophilum]|uniref:Two-component system chemotaxis family CheBCheR fusion protein n=1 Tax=Profundibacterium mesophilum KAUST100406-0324 TaxID=1037889 RepID=A0A921NPX8_9RHOB|nr:EAL domain-containing protein [Profundibacterium mesophilum]KAF0676461.1 two-component system chemotaxis family CheBCheR fusion protein [Profundibacterium mesophilum KAUST100406-0324]
MGLDRTEDLGGYQPELGDPLSIAINLRDRSILRTVERAVTERNVMLAFQPVVPASRPERPVFYEGLIRILDDNGRIVPARDFIGAVETLELGRQIDCLSLEAGLKLLQERPRLRLSINMSARSIGYPDWTRVLDTALAADPSIGERLILEITESSAILMPDMVQVFMNRLQNQGISFAIDDFGSGYTSMRYLKDLYFDILKIDGQFIRGIARSPDNQAVVKALVSIGRHFDMVTIAEFVETGEDAQYLRQIGVDCLQGYYFGAPTIRPRWEPCNNARKKAG